MAARFQELQQLPEQVRDYLYGPERDAWYLAAFRRWGLTDDQRDALEEAILDIFVKKTSLEQFSEWVMQTVGDVLRGKQIAIEIIGHDFRMIEDYLGVDVLAYIRSIGGDPTSVVKQTTATEVVDQAIEELGIGGADPQELSRLRSALTSFLANARTQDQTLGALTRGKKIGGVGLAPATAARVLSTTIAKRDAYVRDGVEIVLELARAEPKPQSAFRVVKPGKGGLLQPEDEAEIAAIRSAMRPQTSAVSIDAAVERVIQKTGAAFKRPESEQRFRTAVASRLRDVRDHAETLDLLRKPPQQGGLGIPEVTARRVLAIIEKELLALHGAAAAPSRRTFAPPALPQSPLAVLQPSPAPTTPVITRPALVPPPPPMQLPVATHQRPVAERPSIGILDRQQAPILKPARQAPPVPPPPPPPMIVEKPKAARVLAQVVEEKVTLLPKAAPPPTLPVATGAPTVPRPSAEPQPRTPPVPQGTPRPYGVPTLKFSSAPSSTKPKIQDIRPVAPRLVGPIEELQQLTLRDFRKIAPIPADTVMRIMEKLDLLGKDSYTKRAEGVKSLRGSPLLAGYADTLNAALLGKKKVDDELAARLQQDRDTMTKAEFEALMDLNAKLRF